jgi:hypothetical protein
MCQHQEACPTSKTTRATPYGNVTPVGWTVTVIVGLEIPGFDDVVLGPRGSIDFHGAKSSCDMGWYGLQAIFSFEDLLLYHVVKGFPIASEAGPCVDQVASLFVRLFCGLDLFQATSRSHCGFVDSGVNRYCGVWVIFHI